MSLKSSEVAEGLGVATQVCVMLQHGCLDVRSRAAESSCIHCEMMALSREDGGHRPVIPAQVACALARNR